MKSEEIINQLERDYYVKLDNKMKLLLTDLFNKYEKEIPRSRFNKGTTQYFIDIYFKEIKQTDKKYSTNFEKIVFKKGFSIAVEHYYHKRGKQNKLSHFYLDEIMLDAHREKEKDKKKTESGEKESGEKGKIRKKKRNQKVDSRLKNNSL